MFLYLNAANYESNAIKNSEAMEFRVRETTQ